MFVSLHACQNCNVTAEFVDTYTDAVYAFIRGRLLPRFRSRRGSGAGGLHCGLGEIDSFRGASPLRTWLLGIARHKVEDYYRRPLQSAQLLERATAEELPAEDLDMEAIADRERTERRARRVLEKLPEHYRAALPWRYWEERSARQMAKAAGRSEKAIERLLTRAREQFRRRWQA